MKLGIWCPAPQTIRPDPLTKPMLDALTQHGGGPDQSFDYAVKVLNRAEELGFDITLIAQRWFGPDLDSWIFAAALAPVVKKMRLMAAIHRALPPKWGLRLTAFRAGVFASILSMARAQPSIICMAAGVNQMMADISRCMNSSA